MGLSRQHGPLGRDPNGTGTVPGQKILPHGPDRNLIIDEGGGIQLVEETARAAA
jgi:hypothetical protein